MATLQLQSTIHSPLSTLIERILLATGESFVPSAFWKPFQQDPQRITKALQCLNQLYLHSGRYGRRYSAFCIVLLQLFHEETPTTLAALLDRLLQSG